MSDKIKSYWIRSGLISIMDRIFFFGFGFGSFVLLVRLISKDEFGIWVLYLTTYSLIEASRTALIQNATIKYLATPEKENRKKIATASIVINFIYSLVVILCIITASAVYKFYWGQSSFLYLLNIYIIINIIYTFFSHIQIMHQSAMNFKGLFWSNFTRQGLFFLYILFLFILKKIPPLDELVYAQAVIIILSSCISFFQARKYIEFSKIIDFGWVKKLLGFGKYVFGTGISSMLYKSLDHYMLGSMLSPVAVALQNTAIRITNFVEIPTMSMAQIVYPRSAMVQSSEGLVPIKNMYERSVGVIMALIIPGLLFFYFFAGFTVQLIAGKQYLDAVPILKLTIFYSLFIPFLRQFGVILDSIGKPKINFMVILGSVILNFINNYFFISLYGITGAARGTLLTFIITFIVTQFILIKILKTNPLQIFKYIYEYYLKGFRFVFNKFNSLKMSRLKPL